jgi:hypothetical protein
MPKALSFLISHPISLWHDDLLFLKPPFIHLPHSLSIYKHVQKVLSMKTRLASFFLSITGTEQS